VPLAEAPATSSPQPVHAPIPAGFVKTAQAKPAYPIVKTSARHGPQDRPSGHGSHFSYRMAAHPALAWPAVVPDTLGADMARLQHQSS